MARKTQIAYGLLLIGAALLVSLTVAPGITYARYHTAVGWNTVIGMTQNPAISSPDTPILTKNVRELEFTLAEGVAEPLCAIEILTAAEGYTAYTAENLTATVAENSVIVQLGQTLPPAGTYRLVITWQAEETAEAQTAAVTFFINYSDV